MRSTDEKPFIKDFNNWPWSMNLTLDLSEQMIEMEHSLMTENNCAKLYWNPSVNIEVKLRATPDRN